MATKQQETNELSTTPRASGLAPAEPRSGQRPALVKWYGPPVKRNADAQTPFAEARTMAQIGDWQAARSVAARALDVDPNNAEVHAAIAWYTSRAPDVKSFDRERLVQHHLTVSNEISPNNPYAHYHQGLIWEDRGNILRARISFEAALAAQADYEPAQKALGAQRRKTSPSLPAVTAHVSRASSARLPVVRPATRFPQTLLRIALAFVVCTFAAYGVRHSAPHLADHSGKIAPQINVASAKAPDRMSFARIARTIPGADRN